MWSGPGLDEVVAETGVDFVPPSVPIRTSSASVPQQISPPMSQGSLGHWMVVAAHASPLTTMAALIALGTGFGREDW